MPDDLVGYYERELGFLRQMGAEFSKKHGKIAQRLGLEPSAKAPLVLERFRVVYRAPIRADVNLGRDA